jgi:hypothetical protein
MVSHGIRQAKRDELAFPVRLKIKVPAHGLGRLLDRMVEWLRGNIAAGDYASHSAPCVGGSAAAFYFRDVEAALAFVRAFPEAELANDLLMPGTR